MSSVQTRSDYKKIFVSDYQDIVAQKIAEGDAIFGWARFDVPAGGNVDFQLTSGDVIPHIFQRVVTTDASELLYSLYENASFTEGSTEVPFVNMNRKHKDKDTGLVTYSDPTNVDVSSATLIEHEVQRSSGVGRTSSVLGMEGVDRTLEPNSSYIFRFKNPGLSAADVFAKFFFYVWEAKEARKIY